MNGVLLADLTTTLPNDMLHKVDLTSMANALEVRTPFLDLRVVEFAFSLPAEAKLRVGSGKYILRDTFGHLLPTTVMTRSKKGFEVPLLELLRGPVSGLVQELITKEKVEAAGLAWKPTQVVMAQFGLVLHRAPRRQPYTLCSSTCRGGNDTWVDRPIALPVP